MIASRNLQTPIRRLASRKPTSINLSKFAPPAAVATNTHYLQRRQAASTTTISEAEASSQILAKQRLNRPVSPHLGIYKPQITWIPSALNRITGTILSGSLYIFGFGYLVAPLFGWHWESQAIAAAFATWPLIAKLGVKTFYAFPFVFHALNGLRHLSWDFSIGVNNVAVARTGWAAVGLTVVSALYLVFAY